MLSFEANKVKGKSKYRETCKQMLRTGDDDGCAGFVSSTNNINYSHLSYSYNLYIILHYTDKYDCILRTLATTMISIYNSISLRIKRITRVLLDSAAEVFITLK